MSNLMENLYHFISILRLRIKLMMDEEFEIFCRDLDYQQTIYAIYFRYF